MAPGPPPAAHSIVVSSVDSLPMAMVGEIYRQALQRYGEAAESGRSVPDLSAALRELDAGDATVLPEVSAELLERFNPSSTAQPDPETLFKALSESLPNGLSVGDFALATDQAVTSKTGTARNIVPLYRTGELDDNALLALNKVAGELTTPDLFDLCDKERHGAKRADIVSNWLDQHGF
ncbi:hypothetical protein SMNI109538_18465 [Smaragdicoccus niigatensis]